MPLPHMGTPEQSHWLQLSQHHSETALCLHVPNDKSTAVTIKLWVDFFIMDTFSHMQYIVELRMKTKG